MQENRGNRFIKNYHKAFVRAAGDQLEKMQRKIASDWVGGWMKGLSGPLKNVEEFTGRFQEFLVEDLGFADGATVSVSGDFLTIDVEGCSICLGNEYLRQRGETTSCPILATGLLAISRVLGKRAVLLGVEKEDPFGSCKIKYRLTRKKL